MKSKGTIRLHNIKTVRHEKGHLVAVSRSGELGVVDEFGRERERYKIPYGATITVNDGDVVAAGQSVANWDPHTHPVVTEVAGMIKFSDFVDGITVTSQVDDITGLTSTVVLDPKQRGWIRGGGGGVSHGRLCPVRIVIFYNEWNCSQSLRPVGGGDQPTRFRSKLAAKLIGALHTCPLLEEKLNSMADISTSMTPLVQVRQGTIGVIASAAKQSIAPRKVKRVGLLRRERSSQ